MFKKLSLGSNLKVFIDFNTKYEPLPLFVVSDLFIKYSMSKLLSDAFKVTNLGDSAYNQLNVSAL